MQPKSERFEMRLDEATISRIEVWRAKQRDIPSRSEAIRRLVDIGLSNVPGGSISLSDGEKLLIAMMGDLYKTLKVKGEIDPEFVNAVLYGGHYWGLDWKYTGLFHNHVDKEQVVTDVVDILDMWSFIESSYAKLTTADKKRVEVEAAPFGKHVRFSGFDGNNESTHYSVARFLVEDMDRFTSFAKRDLNSHSPSLIPNSRMLAVFLPMRPSLTGGAMSASQIIQVLNARKHKE